jgi:hypothetical protein
MVLYQIVDCSSTMALAWILAHPLTLVLILVLANSLWMVLLLSLAYSSDLALAFKMAHPAFSVLSRQYGSHRVFDAVTTIGSPKDSWYSL